MSDQGNISGTPRAAAASRILGHSDLPVAELHRFINSTIKTYACAYVPVDNCPVDVPRYGALSHTLQGLPIVLFDEPAMCEQFKTAFTQGTHVFINAHFAYDMLQKDAASNMRENRMRFVLLHEAAHVAFLHTEGRLRGAAPPEVRGYAFDAVLNARILSGYKDLRIGEVAEWIIAGTKEGIETFKEMSEEQAVAMLMKDPEQFAAKSGAGKPQDGPHFGSTQEFAKWMEEQGLSDALKEMGIPPSSDAEGHKALADQIKQHVNAAAERTMRDQNAARAAGAKLPGAALNEAFLQQVELVNKPRLDFKVKLRQALRELGGTKFSVTEDIPDDFRYTDGASLGFTSQPWLPGRGPVAKAQKQVHIIVDTSGSMGDADLSEAFTEIFSFARTVRSQVPELLVHCGDTSLRGKPMRLVPGSKELIREQNQKQVTVAGRGGTDLQNCLAELCQTYEREMRRGKVAAILYFSDLGDHPPVRAELPTYMPRVTMICASAHFNAGFAESIATWADVVPIEDHKIVRIEDAPIKAPQAATAPSAPGMSMG